MASFFSRCWRVLALCAATVVLHYLALAWLAAQISPLPGNLPKAAPPISAQLRLTLPAHVPDLSAAPVARALAKSSPRPAAPAALTESEPAPTPEDSASVPSMPVASVTKMDVADAAPPASLVTAAPEPAPAPEPALTTHRYNVNLPPSAEFVLDVKRIDPDGTVWNGVGAMSWRVDGGNYTMSVEAGLDLLVTRINLLVLTSEGQIDDSGIAPVTATEKRRGRALTATHFQRKERRITFSASEQSYPLLAGAQDKATLPFQLAGIGRADVNQLHGDIDMFVGEDKDANMFRFNLVGEEELDTRMGRLVTWHLSRPPKPGSYSSRLDIWLAPSRGWYPVQIRNTEANGAVTTQSVSNMSTFESSGR